MSEHRKHPPQVREEDDVELLRVPQGEQTVVDTSRSQAEPKTFLERVELDKLTFGQKLIGWCIFLIVALSVMSHAWGPAGDGGEVRAAIELLKLVTTTALGFVFAKTQNTSSSGRAER